ncbi:dihydroorotase [Helicobacter saguini]|uniref:Dihydroorotase n=2 Tax=Helicobacter saguini TaxID=1548018 RepID=A0A347VTW9_9HELI|nr:dihydroorotase [Helicobacter saguini]MWV67943.1 dihydroorotase [Helicobacter saguini]MWV70590.1 dihydroorotase [Helicobacter saguini]MWV72494.1 dihydroorotase [Helicobacter saguini]TLD94833.1 dihydroorotase [Helicobacter saguini]
MPNLNPPLFNIDSVIDYQNEILDLSDSYFKSKTWNLNGENGLKTTISITKDNKKLQNIESKNSQGNSPLDSNEYLRQNSPANFQHKKDSKHPLNTDSKNKKITPFTPLMSLYISDNLDSKTLIEAKKNGIKILKLYPKGSTTNSKDGLSEILSQKFLKLLESAEKLSLILSIHGESNGFSLNREKEFLKIFTHLARTFPRLKIIIEHLSDRRSIEAVGSYANLYGTITLHHMLLTLDDVIGGKLNAFNFCKPVVKTALDRDAILKTALSGSEKFSFGSDSAPHTISAKLAGAAGIFSAPTLLQGLCTLFAKHNRLENLQKFISDNAMKIYDINLPFKKSVKMVAKPCTFGDSIPCDSEKIAVFLGEKSLNFSIENISVE